jgi:hypothetical protein
MWQGKAKQSNDKPLVLIDRLWTVDPRRTKNVLFVVGDYCTALHCTTTLYYYLATTTVQAIPSVCTQGSRLPKKTAPMADERWLGVSCDGPFVGSDARLDLTQLLY